MTDSAFQCILGSVEFTMMPGGDFGQVVQQLEFGSTARGDVPRLAVVRMDTPRTFTFPALINASTKDEAIAIVRAVNRALSVTNTLTVHTKNATETVAFRTYPSGSCKQLPTQEWESGNWQQVSITLTIEPYAYGDEVTIVNAMTAPGVIDLSDTEGEYPAPLTIDVDAGAEKLHSLYVAWNEHPEWDGWITPAGLDAGEQDALGNYGLTWTNMAAKTSDSTAYSGYYKRTNATTSRAYATLETKNVPPGDYVVLMRAKMTGNASATLDIAQQTRWTATVPANTTVWRYYEVGDLSLPYSLVRGTGTAGMQIGVTSSSASYHCCVDQVVLLPYRSGWQSWHPPVAYDSASYYYTDVYLASDGTVYLDDVCHLEHVMGAPIRSLTGELIVLCDEDGGNHDHTHLDVTVTQTPRYSLYR